MKEKIWKNISYIGILSIICIITFLTAKYIVRSKIGWENNIIDVSEKYK